YTPDYFYPVSIGDVLHAKYQVLFKFGYGTTSTIWLCRDLQSALIHANILSVICSRS
ncbi:hypothetical protein C8R42DRAFT_585835, partial [Lentinula raphanica]